MSRNEFPIREAIYEVFVRATRFATEGYGAVNAKVSRLETEAADLRKRARAPELFFEPEQRAGLEAEAKALDGVAAQKRVQLDRWRFLLANLQVCRFPLGDPETSPPDAALRQQIGEWQLLQREGLTVEA